MLMEERETVVSFDLVIERLIEAWGFLWRMPDREAGWLHSPGVTTLYQARPLTLKDIQREWGIEAAAAVQRSLAEAAPRCPGLRSAEVDRMYEALGWIEYVEPRDRRLVGMVLAQLDRGAARPSWTALKAALGWGGHPDTLSKRWERAISRIAICVNRNTNGGNLQPDRVKSLPYER